MENKKIKENLKSGKCQCDICKKWTDQEEYFPSKSRKDYTYQLCKDCASKIFDIKKSTMGVKK